MAPGSTKIKSKIHYNMENVTTINWKNKKVDMNHIIYLEFQIKDEESLDTFKVKQSSVITPAKLTEDQEITIDLQDDLASQYDFVDLTDPTTMAIEIQVFLVTFLPTSLTLNDKMKGKIIDALDQVDPDKDRNNTIPDLLTLTDSLKQRFICIETYAPIEGVTIPNLLNGVTHSTEKTIASIDKFEFEPENLNNILSSQKRWSELSKSSLLKDASILALDLYKHNMQDLIEPPFEITNENRPADTNAKVDKIAQSMITSCKNAKPFTSVVGEIQTDTECEEKYSKNKFF